MNDLTWKYVKELKNENLIENFEIENLVKLPFNLVECIKKYNGGRPNRKIFDTEVSKERVFKSLLSYNHDDLETVYLASEVLKNEGQKLIPIASDPSGNYICYNPEKKYIELWLHETNTSEKISDDFDSFLNSLYED